MVIKVGLKTVKLLLLVFNLFCILSGLALIVLGIQISEDIDPVKDFSGTDALLASESVLAIVLGCVVFALASFGFCGTIKHSHVMMTTYAFLMLVLIAAQVAMSLQLFTNLVRTNQKVEMWFTRHFHSRLWQSSDSNPAADDDVERLQRSFKCCGNISYQDWGSLEKLPRSCCSDKSVPTGCRIIEEGCQAVLEQFVRKSQQTLAWFLLGMAMFEFLTFSLNCCVANGIQNHLEVLNLL
ncbi:CD63 antigen-like [Malaya genurostris]|uniref:CD63 antigen-like n=1 Tax=Malaya genurostris TaxID=325434 RepID=UPI0026F3C3B8|nr:CD63 antigen-like [Malaya genurostris]